MLRFVTYNVRYFGHRTRGLMSTESALNGIADALAALDPLPDVVALQEVETYSVRADLGRRRRGRSAQLPRLVSAINERLAPRERRFAGSYFPSHRYRLAKGQSLYTTGLAILVADSLETELAESAPPVDVTHRRIRAMARWKQTRICAHLRVRHRTSGERIDVFNTHLSLPQFFSWSSIKYVSQLGHGDNQVRELENVLSFINTARTADHVVLMGDFNSIPGSPVYDRVLDTGLLLDPLRIRRDLDLSAYRRYPTAGFLTLRMHLDYMFASPSLEFLDFDGTHAFGQRESPFHGLSDHAPIIGSARPID